MATPDQTHTTDRASAAELMKQLSEQTSVLIRQEMELARAELSEKGKNAGVGAGLFGGAGAIGFYTLGTLIAAVVLLLATAVEPWLAAAIVFAVLLVITGVLAMLGKNRLSKATPPAPQATIETTKADIDTVKEHARQGRSS